MDETAWRTVSVGAGVDLTVGPYSGVEEVSRWGSRQGSEVGRVDAVWVELAVVLNSGRVVVDVGTVVVKGRPVVISGTSGGSGVVARVVLPVVGLAADMEVVSVEDVKVGAEEVVMSVIFRGVGTAVVMVAPGDLDTVWSGMVTLSVVVLLCEAAEVGAGGTAVLGSLIVLVVGNAGTVGVKVSY